MLNKKCKIFVAGHNGMVGSSICRVLKKNGYKKIITIEKKKLNMNISWKGKCIKEVGYDKISKKNIIFVDKNYIRPLDVNTLLGNASKARRELKWKPQINIHKLIDEMIDEEMNILGND